MDTEDDFLGDFVKRQSKPVSFFAFFYVNKDKNEVWKNRSKDGNNEVATFVFREGFERRVWAIAYSKRGIVVEGYKVEHETRDFVTIYNQDFPAKVIEKRQEGHKVQPAYPPPLNIYNGPYKRYLNTRQKNVTLPLNEQTEDPQDTLNRIRDKHSRLRNHLPEVIPDQDLIEQKENEVKETIYHTEFSKGVYSPRVKIFGRGKVVDLPDDWVISETIQQKSFKNPWKFVTKDLLHVKKIAKPPDNLVPSVREREILRIRTGDSEYDATIAATGNRVVNECLHGPPLPFEPKIYAKGPNSPRSECSEILAQTKLVIPSNVI